MLRIAIPSTGQSGLTFNSFEKFSVPPPPNGVDAEINNEVVLLFNDEQQAVEYAESLFEVSSDLDNDKTPQKLIVNDIVGAIYNNNFVKSYRDDH
jgi:regulatory protein YycI of two-component signal transduction system YycFG